MDENTLHDIFGIEERETTYTDGNWRKTLRIFEGHLPNEKEERWHISLEVESIDKSEYIAYGNDKPRKYFFDFFSRKDIVMLKNKLLKDVM